MKDPNRPTRNLSSLGLLLAMAIVLAAGCGSEDPQPRDNQIIDVADAGDTGDSGDSGDQNDASDTDGEENNQVDPCDEVVCNESEQCIDGICEIIVDEGYGCAAPRDLGELSAGVQSFEMDGAVGQPNQLQTTCAAADNSPEAVFSFTVPGPSRVKFEITSSEQPLVIEVRDEVCNDPATTQFCADASGEQFDALADTTYYLVVEARQDFALGDFTVEVELTELVCAPQGSWTCGEENERIQCWAGTEERSHQCVDGCSDGRCHGDICDNALEITASQTLTGELAVLEREVNLENSPSCSSEGISGPPTPGADLFLSFPGLQEGQLVRIDVRNSPVAAAIGIMSTCAQTPIECIAADSNDQLLEWTVPEDGDYFAIIDPLFNQSGPFEYEIEIIE